MHEIPSHLREPILHRLCSDEVPCTLVIVTTDLQTQNFAQKSLILFGSESRGW